MLKTSVVDGFNVLSYKMPHVETVSLGIWACIGSRYETKNNSGMSHFVEHMVFKGTKTRSSLDIAKTIENVGGYMNAYTTREMTGYYAKVIKKDVELAFDILSDMLLHPAFDNSELSKERGVILQEIAQTYDNPSDIIFDYFQQECFKNQQLGGPILGTPDTVKATTQDDLFKHISGYFADRNNIVFSAAGNIEHETLEWLVSQYFIPELHESSSSKSEESAVYTGGEFEDNRGLEQTHIVMGFNGISYKDPEYYNMLAYSSVLGNGMSSKLFQNIREKYGHAYSIYSFPSFFKDAGVLGVYAGTNHESKDEVVGMIIDEMKKFEVSNEELQKAKSQLSASVFMELESTSGMADSLASDFIRYGRVRPTEEVLSKISLIDREGIMSIAEKVLKSTITKVVVC